MTAPTITPYRPAGPAGPDGFAQLLRAEWTKFRTVRGWLIGLVVAALALVVIGPLAAGGSDSSCQHVGGGPVRHGRACMPTFPVGPGGLAVQDSFYFVRQPLAGSGSITVRVTSLKGLLPTANGNPTGQPASPGLVPWAKAGIIVKDSTRPGSAYAAVMVTADHGVRMQDDYTSDRAGQPGAVSAASPRWLRLTRAGGTVTGYDSADGTHWARIGTVHLASLAPTVQAGLFTASPGYEVITQNFGGGTTGSGGPSLATAVFDHLSRSGRWPGGRWASGYVGGGPGIGGYHQAGRQFTVSGSGDIAPVLPDDPGKTIDSYLVGTFAGLIAVIVVATLFITAEYRRGLIRTTFAASPSRGRVLAAKAIVTGAAAFVTGLAAAAAALYLGGWVTREHGSYVLPVSGLAELRIVLGTGALFAAAAVLSLALGAVLRRSAAAVAIVIVAIVLPYILGVASVLPVGATDWLLRITPAAAFAVQQAMQQYPQVTALYSPGTGYFPLAPWAGLAVLCGYAALALGLAAVLLRRRDA